MLDRARQEYRMSLLLFFLLHRAQAAWPVGIIVLTRL
jgi:hypothetical protein